MENPESNNLDEKVLPLGPALPPSRRMRYRPGFFRNRTITILNEKRSHAPININGADYVVPKMRHDFGRFEVTVRWPFGVIVTIVNKSAWVLRVEYKS